MSKYEKSVEYEEEGSYHRREIEPIEPTRSNQHSKTTYEVVRVPASGSSAAARRSPQQPAESRSGDDEDYYQGWTTSKRKINHKTRQVETRVLRQVLVEDGKVIADSGPQVTTRIKEDNTLEECEKEKAPKNKSKFEALEGAQECGDGSHGGRVLGEKKEIQRVTREVREENMQYHDERFNELTGKDVHRRAIQAPHELITINDHNDSRSAPRGKMVHYSNKGKKYRDTDEILEVAKLAIDGSITKEVKRTKHHEESSDEELPDETGEAEALRNAPTVTRSSRRHVDYVNDFDDTSTPSCSSDDETKAHTTATKHRALGAGRQHHVGVAAAGRSRDSHRRDKHRHDDPAFPRYEIDPLLNSLRDEDFKPAPSGAYRTHSPGRHVEHSLERKDRSDSDYEQAPSRSRNRHHHHQARPVSPVSASSSAQRVDIPEEYRANKQRLMSSKGKSSPGERGLSPVAKSHLSQASHKSSRSQRSRKEDVSVQAHLTDEEEERRSLQSSVSGRNSHENATRQLQRQSTANSSRNYYFGESRKRHSHRRKSSVSSVTSSASSLSDPKERMRKQGIRSRDSGFRSPGVGKPSKQQQQIYSVSSKAKSRRNDEGRSLGAASPAPTTASAGQRSVKTTTTTLSAELADRAPSRTGRSSSTGQRKGGEPKASKESQRRTLDHDDRSGSADDRRPFDTISLSSLGPNATTIKVPYKQVNQVQAADETPKRSSREDRQLDVDSIEETSSVMKLGEDIESLQRRLSTISGEDGGRRAGVATKQRSRAPEHFDYKTIVANVDAAPVVRRQQVIDTYNVRVIEHSSPFHRPLGVSALSASQLSSSIARLEAEALDVGPELDNNNETNFSLDDYYVKHKAVPAVTDNNNDDRASMASSDSLRSSRTYDIRAAGVQDHRLEVNINENGDGLNHERDFPVEMASASGQKEESKGEEEERTQPQPQPQPQPPPVDDKRPPAWVFDLRDGSSTAIIPPERPKKAPAPEIGAKTEELAQAPGGRSYYLELIEPNTKQARRQRPSSIDSLYSRWNSYSTLLSSGNYTGTGSGLSGQSGARKLAAPSKSQFGLNSSATDDSRRSRQIRPAALLDSMSRPILSGSSQMVGSQRSNSIQQQDRRQLPFGGPPMGNRSKSISCLSTRPTKYSIYGGFKRPDSENKPVPRLSYSRTIGPKSQRQINAQPKTPSRYLKMK